MPRDESAKRSPRPYLVLLLEVVGTLLVLTFAGYGLLGSYELATGGVALERFVQVALTCIAAIAVWSFRNRVEAKETDHGA